MKLLRIFFAPAFLLVATAAAPAIDSTAVTPTPSPDEPELIEIVDTPGLPRVLLIGDSISQGYTLAVRARLTGQANVHRPGENCRDTAFGLARLDTWLGHGKWDVIHFNFGLHDLKYVDIQGHKSVYKNGMPFHTIADYEANLRELVTRLRRTGAKLIFAATTPVPDDVSFEDRVPHDELRYNEAAERVMKEFGVGIDDLHAFVEPRQTQLLKPHDVHMTPAGYEKLADLVAASIKSALSGERR